ncbi:hypothetical protein I552_8172 [Mycobacterium xenopi 3993]|nr:hypothetical protein I552_8172 [Mycobacterium xenopi 3993]
MDRLTAITVAPARAAIDVTVVPMPPPPAPDTTTTRPSNFNRSTITTIVRTRYVTLHLVEHYSAQAKAESSAGRANA